MISAAYRLAELERRVANIVRVGVIQSADYPNARVKVTIGALLTGWLPWMTHRASNDIDWHAPEVGEQVIVFSPAGELASGFVLPAVYQATAPAPENVATKHTTKYQDGTIITYDRAAHKLTASVQGEADLTTTGKVKVTAGGDIDLVSSGNVNIQGATIAITGPVTASSTITASGDVKAGSISLESHVHSGVQSGGSMTGPPT